MERFDIDYLIRNECFCRDTFQFEKLRNSWHPDSKQTLVDISWIKGTVDDWINGSKAMAKTGVGALHTMQPAEIEIKDDRAIATTTISIRARSPYKGVDCILTSWAHQRQSFEKVGVWKIVPFEAIYIRHGVSLPWPGSVLGPLDERAQEIMKNARHPFKFLAWQMVLIGETVRNDLQGYDDEATWKPLVESNERLLATGED